MNVLSLFDGISCGQLALERGGIKVDNYFASEIDKYAIKCTQHNFPDTIQLGSVTDVKSENLPKIDLLMGGSPCQGFSFAGKQLNFNDPRSALFFEYVRLKNELKPKWFLLENVRMKKDCLNVITEYLGVEPVKINSSLVSAQNRVRWYWTNIPFETPNDLEIMLSNRFETYDGIFVRARGGNKGGLQNYKGKAPCITTSAWEHNFFLRQGDANVKFSPNDAEWLQTIPKDYTSSLSDHKRYKALGNGWTVDVVAHILKGINS